MVKVSLKFSKAFAERINKAPAKLKKEISMEVQAGGEFFAELADKELKSGILKAPTGFLANSIRPEKTGEFTTEVIVHKEYGPYIEWGTIKKVDVPADLKPYALNFIGKGIKKNGGIEPRPYFFKQEPIVRKDMTEKIENILSSLYD